MIDRSERKESPCLWIQLAEDFLPESLPVADRVEAPEVEFSFQLCSDRSLPVRVERVCVGVCGNLSYVGQVEATSPLPLDAPRVIEPCGTLEFAGVRVRATVQSRNDDDHANSRSTFGLCVWADWRSDGVLYTTRRAVLQQFEPVGTESDEGFSFTPIDGAGAL